MRAVTRESPSVLLKLSIKWLRRLQNMLHHFFKLQGVWNGWSDWIPFVRFHPIKSCAPRATCSSCTRPSRLRGTRGSGDENGGLHFVLSPDYARLRKPIMAVGFWTLCFCFPTRMLHLNASFCQLQQKNNPLNHLLFCSTFDIKVMRLSSWISTFESSLQFLFRKS